MDLFNDFHIETSFVYAYSNSKIAIQIVSNPILH